ncbi:MAG: hypothetical protein JXR91_05505 [Deltaproteobacteria bacterium]|nr:hypothetical protein [Deltaproteobacteria bacterium]
MNRLKFLTGGTLFLFGILTSGLLFSCSSTDSSIDGPGGNGTYDTNSTDSGNSTDSNGAGDTDADSDSDSDSDGTVINFDSYLWVANSSDGTVSKIDTKLAVELARYRTCPQTVENTYCDPSRTSVNLHGDMVVTNRYPNPGTTSPKVFHPSSVTKIISSKADCVDRNGNGKIDTSTGPDNILPWPESGPEDECIAWNTPLKERDGARATGWDGTADPKTGKGGNVIIGSCKTGEADLQPSDSKDDNVVYMLDGDTGDIIETSPILWGGNTVQTECFYGGAMDFKGWFWMMDGFGFPKRLVGFNTNAPSSDNLILPTLHCGYGISVDSHGRVWTGGKSYNMTDDNHPISCLQRYSPWDGGNSVDSEDLDGVFLRGIAVGSNISEGFVWAAETSGNLYKVDINDLSVVDIVRIRGEEGNTDPNGLIGVAIDPEGYIWVVSAFDNAVYKFDPETKKIIKVPVGKNPYTYSDMTGMQLKAAISIM